MFERKYIHWDKTFIDPVLLILFWRIVLLPVIDGFFPASMNYLGYQPSSDHLPCFIKFCMEFINLVMIFFSGLLEDQETTTLYLEQDKKRWASFSHSFYVTQFKLWHYALFYSVLAILFIKIQSSKYLKKTNQHKVMFWQCIVIRSPNEMQKKRNE